VSAADFDGHKGAPGGTTLTGHLLVVHLGDAGGHRKVQITPEQTAWLELVRAAGHHVLLQTRMPLIGLLPLVRRLGAADGGYAVASDGAVTVRLESGTPGGYEVLDAAMFAPAPLIRQIQALTSGTLLAVEQIGGRWRVNRPWPRELGLVGSQRQVTNHELSSAPTPQVLVYAPALARDVDVLGSLTRLTVTVVGDGIYRVTAPTGASPDAAVQNMRSRLAGPPVTTTSLEDLVHDARPLIPAAACRAGLSALAAQLVAAVATADGRTAIRAWHQPGSRDLAVAEVWTRSAMIASGGWIRHAPLPAAHAASIRDVEHAAIEAGLTFPRGNVGRRRAQWRSTATPEHEHEEPEGAVAREPGFALPVEPDIQDEPAGMGSAGTTATEAASLR
jgi:hypothetical protein